MGNVLFFTHKTKEQLAIRGVRINGDTKNFQGYTLKPPSLGFFTAVSAIFKLCCGLFLGQPIKN